MVGIFRSPHGAYYPRSLGTRALRGYMYMDQTFDDRNTTASDQDTASSSGSSTTGACRGENPGGNSSGGSGGDLLSCLPLPTSCTTILRKLRAPAISIRYSLDKQIIPDLDTAQTQTSGSNSGTSDTSFESSQSGGSAGNTASNTMSESGSFTVRFFDVAVGGMLVAVGICMLKCCCGMKRMCRHWF